MGFGRTSIKSKNKTLNFCMFLRIIFGLSCPLSKYFVYLFKIYIVYTDTSFCKTGKDNRVALAFEQDYEILTDLNNLNKNSTLDLFSKNQPKSATYTYLNIKLNQDKTC